MYFSRGFRKVARQHTSGAALVTVLGLLSLSPAPVLAALRPIKPDGGAVPKLRPPDAARHGSRQSLRIFRLIQNLMNDGLIEKQADGTCGVLP